MLLNNTLKVKGYKIVRFLKLGRKTSESVCCKVKDVNRGISFWSDGKL